MNESNFDMQKPLYEALKANSKFMSGLQNMMEMADADIAKTPKELVYSEDRIKVYHYIPTTPNPHVIPVLVCYAPANKQYMMDLQEDRSVVKKWLAGGLDVYMIDWGYPTSIDKFLTMEDYIDGYLNNIVDFVCERHHLKSINLFGFCQGATMSVIYTALYPKKIKNLAVMCVPFDFSVKDGLLFRWSSGMDIESLVESAHGVLTGEMMNFSYNMLKPVALNLDKYVYFFDKLDDKEALKDFFRMEQWIYDSPDQAGPMITKFVKDLYRDNKLMKNELELGGRIVRLDNIKMPLLCILAAKDHLIVPSSSRPLIDAVPTKDKTLLEFPVGHIGLCVSSKAQNDIGPTMVRWFLER